MEQEQNRIDADTLPWLSQDRIELILDAAKIGVWEWNLQTNTLYFAPSYYRLSGYEPYEFPSTYDEWEKRIHPEDMIAAQARISQYLSGELPDYIIEFRFLRKDGSYMWIHSRGKILKRDETGAPVLFSGVHVDVTERKNAEVSLDKERRFNNAIMDSIPGMLYLYDASGNLIRWNRKHEELTGYGPEELSRMTLLGWYDNQEDIDRITAGVSHAMEHGYGEADGNLRNKDGSHTLYRFNAVTLELDGKTYFAGIGMNIEEQHLYEQQLKDSEAKYRSLFENMFHGFSLHEVIVDEAGIPVDYRYLDVNSEFCRTTGLSKEQWIGHRVLELLPDLEHTWVEKYGEIALHGGTLHFDNYVAALGKYFETVAFQSAPGQFAVLSSDITEKILQKKALEEAYQKLEEANSSLENRVRERTIEMEQANLELEMKMLDLERAQNELVRSERLASLGELVAGVAHEINTPIGVSVTAASYLDSTVQEFSARMESQELTPELKKFLSKSQDSSRMILANLERAARLIKSFKQVSVDRTYDAERRINLREYVDEVVMSLIPSFKKTPHRLLNRIGKDIWISTHPGAISQILSNLMMNALQHAFTPEMSGLAEIDAVEEDAQVLLMFEDNGTGMPPEVLARVFDPFFTTKRGFGGSGLGLFIVHNLVMNELNGSIDCLSLPGQGTTFRITLPKSAREGR